MLDLLTSTAFDLAGQPVSWAEPLGFLTGLVTVALAVPQRVETFPVGIANNVFFLVLFWDARLYADAGPRSGSPPPARGSPRCSGPRAHSRIPARPLRPWTLRRTDSQPPSTSRSASPAARSIRSATSAAGWRQRPST